MAPDRLIGMKCPNCRKVHPNTLAHLEARWEDDFSCQKCGAILKIDREKALAAIGGPPGNGIIVLEMTEAG